MVTFLVMCYQWERIKHGIVLIVCKARRQSLNYHWLVNIHVKRHGAASKWVFYIIKAVDSPKHAMLVR